jgi:hypothetical protein
MDSGPAKRDFQRVVFCQRMGDIPGDRHENVFCPDQKTVRKGTQKSDGNPFLRNPEGVIAGRTTGSKELFW